MTGRPGAEGTSCNMQDSGGRGWVGARMRREKGWVWARPSHLDLSIGLGSSGALCVLFIPHACILTPLSLTSPTGTFRSRWEVLLHDSSRKLASEMPWFRPASITLFCVSQLVRATSLGTPWEQKLRGWPHFGTPNPWVVALERGIHFRCDVHLTGAVWVHF